MSYSSKERNPDDSSELESPRNEDKNESGNSTTTSLYTSDDFDAMKQLVVTQDYSGKSLDDLYVCVGDIVYMSVEEQAGDEWLWVHSLRLNSSGYIPIQAAKDIALVQKATV